MDLQIKQFWESGSGQQLIKWSGAQVSLNDQDKMAVLSTEYDIAGDNAAKALFNGRKFEEAYGQITKLSQVKVTDDDALPPAVKAMFLIMQEKPAWLNETLIQSGSELCMRSGTNALVALRDYGLMSGYDFAFLNKALLCTGALKKGPAKRITDTLDFWVHVTRRNALTINAPGYQYIVRTRMIHSFSRIMITSKNADWDQAKWGVPINWGDMIATNIAFSLFYLHGLCKLGLRISEREELGVFHLWKYVGYLLGIPEHYLPNNKKEATEIFYLWTSRQESADEGSKQLAHALENEALASNIFKRAYQKNFLKYLHICYVRFLMDDATCNRLGLSTAPLYFLFPTGRKIMNIVAQQIINMSPKIYQRSVSFGNLLQVKISEEYLKADSLKH